MKNLVFLLCGAMACHPAHSETAGSGGGVAVAIICDTSGSMLESVPSGGAGNLPKFKLAKAALAEVVGKINDFAQTTPVEACLITFQGTRIPLQKWDAQSFEEWGKNSMLPVGGTPLGEAIRDAAVQLSGSKLARKHIVVITDGASNGPLSPEKALRDINSGPNPPRLYVVAFDTGSEVFKPLRAGGALISSASGENLGVELSALFGEKILLEAEE